MIKKLTSILIVILCLITIPTCDFGVDDKTLTALNKLIDTLDSWPGQWETALTNTIDEVEKVGTTLSKQIAKDLRSVETQAFVLTACSVDYIGTYIKMEGIRIRHENWPKKYPDEPQYEPTVCTTEPPDSISSNNSTAVFVGYFFNRYSGGFTADIEDKDGSIIKNDLPVIITTDYRLTVDLQGVNWLNLHLDQYDSPRLSLKWTGDKSELLIQSLGWIVDETSKYKLPSYGGNEGGESIFYCPNDYVITGVSGRSGAKLDAIQFRCSKLNPDGTIGGNIVSSNYYGSTTGGGVYDANCPGNKMINSIKGYHKNVIYQIAFGCGDINNVINGVSSSSIGPWGGTSDNPTPFANVCPVDHTIIGVTVRHGSLIDNLEFICGKIEELY